MNERHLTDLLRHVDDVVPLDVDALDFKARLRTELDHTLVHADDAWGSSAVRHPTPGGRRQSMVLAYVAMVGALVVGSLAILASRSADAPSGPVTIPSAPTTSPTTTVPTLDPVAACARFRSASVEELLSGVVTDDVTAVDVEDLEARLDTLSADVRASSADDPIGPVLARMQDASSEARLRLQDGDRSGALTALGVVRTEASTAPVESAFAACFRR